MQETFKNFIYKSADIDIRISAFILSCLLFLYAIYIDPLLSDDAYIFLKAIELFNTDGLPAMMVFYGWPGYPLIINFADRILPGGPVFAGYIVNMLCYGILTVAFINFIQELRPQGSRYLKLFAAFAILFLPETAELRHTFMRDSGMWAFALLSLVSLVRFNRNGKLINAVQWFVYIAIAAIFRLESLLLLGLAPFSSLLWLQLPLAIRFRKFLILICIPAAAMLPVLLISLFAGINFVDIISYAWRAYIPLFMGYLEVFSNTARDMGSAIFDDRYFSGDFQSINITLLVIAYIYSYIAITLKALGLPLSIILFYGMAKSASRPDKSANGPFYSYAIISGFYLFAFMFAMHFLVQRYTDFLVILLLGLVVLTVDSLYTSMTADDKAGRFYKLFGFLAFYLFIDSTISFGHSQRYLIEAVDWTSNELQENSVLYTNNRPIAYFSGLVNNYDQVTKNQLGFLSILEPGDYIALELRDYETDLKSRLETDSSLHQVERFSNKDEDEVLIFRKI